MDANIRSVDLEHDSEVTSTETFIFDTNTLVAMRLERSFAVNEPDWHHGLARQVHSSWILDKFDWSPSWLTSRRESLISRTLTTGHLQRESSLPTFSHLSPALQAQAGDRISHILATQPTVTPVADNDRFIVRGLEKWEGRIIEVDGEIFTAELTSLTDDRPAVHADFPLDLLAGEEAGIGDIVYVSVRTVWEDGDVNPSRTTSVKLRRLGVWTDDQMNAIKARADQRYEEIAKYVE